jgi:Arc/MetJ-type ribon-helix-helix transcriptional regulator
MIRYDSMKPVRKTITLPDDLADFATEQSKANGEPENLSKYIRDLIRRDKAENESKIRKKAA